MKTYTYFRGQVILEEADFADKKHRSMTGDVLRRLAYTTDDGCRWYIYTAWGSWLPVSYTDLPKELRLWLLITS